MSVICPVCRSVLDPVSHLDYAAPYAQRVNCPVCGYPIDMSTGLPLPQQYDGFNIITYNKPVVAWDTVKASAEAKAASLGLQSSIAAPTSSESYLSQTAENIVPDLTKALGSVTGAVGSAAGQGVQGFLSGLGAPLVIGVIAVFLLIFFMKD